MKLQRRAILAAAVASLALGAVTPAAFAQSYPSRPVTLVVPFAAGGATDLLARVMARALEKHSGQSFVVENMGGAGATLGTAKVANAAPDGYTLLLGSSSALVMAPHLYSSLKYDPFESFEPIAKIASAPYVLVTRADSTYGTFEQLVEHARKNPGRLNYGSPGAGSALHLTIELMADGAKFDAMHIPYRGSSFAWTGLFSGDVDFIIDTPSGVVPMAQAGRVNTLAVTSEERLEAFPQVPTLDEAGLKDFKSEAWFAVLAPKGTSPEVVSRLEELVGKAVADPEVLENMKTSHFTPAGAVEGGLAGEMRREYARWGDVIKNNNIKLD